jgi:hypothetical protein
MTPESIQLSLRHAVATLAYRAAKVLRDAPKDFENSRAGQSTRTAGQILAHLGDLMDWAVCMADGRQEWHDSAPRSWNQEIDRFFAALKAFDERLAMPEPVRASAEKLFQGPIADALTHVGQLATLRRLAGSGIRGENYYLARINVGRVGMDQPPAVFEFD